VLQGSVFTEKLENIDSSGERIEFIENLLVFVYGIGSFLNSLLLFFAQGTLQFGLGLVAHGVVPSRLQLLS
jgi:hypothetical protein